jgi:hypothetical protein
MQNMPNIEDVDQFVMDVQPSTSIRNEHLMLKNNYLNPNMQY